MTLTAKGFAGGPMADIDYGIGSAGGCWVESTAALAVTAVGGTRSVSIAVGNGAAFGVRVINDAAITQALTAPGSGGAWYMLALRFNWSTKSVTLQALAGPTIGGTAAPTAIPTALPGTMTTAPGTSFDMPLAWAFVNSANTTVTLFDLRLLGSYLDQLAAFTQNSLRVAALIKTPHVGAMMPALEGPTQVTYRWGVNSGGTASWLPWDSEWTPSAGFTYSGVTASAGSMRYRYRAGRVLVEFLLVASANSTGSINVNLPGPADQSTALGTSGQAYQAGYSMIGRAWRYSPSQGGRWYDHAISMVSNGTQVGFGNTNSAFYMDGIGMASGDQLTGQFEYDPLTAP